MQDHVVALLLLFKGIFLLFSIMELYFKLFFTKMVLDLHYSGCSPFCVSCCGCHGSQVAQMHPSQATAYELLLAKGPSAHHRQLCLPT